MVFISKVNNYMFRPIAAILRLLQFFSKSVIFEKNYNNLKMAAIGRNM